MSTAANTTTKIAIAKEENPVYKIQSMGKFGLTDVDLLAQILTCSYSIEVAMSKAREILAALNYDLWKLGRLTAAEISALNITEKATASIMCALELGRRRALAERPSRQRVTCSRDAFNYIAPILEDLNHEEFWFLVLNKANEIVSRERLSIGGTAGTVVDIKLLFNMLLSKGAAAFICVHNHPSGSLQPSQADNDLTRRMRKASELLDLPMLDHLIISERGYYSFADEGNL